MEVKSMNSQITSNVIRVKPNGHGPIPEALIIKFLLELDPNLIKHAQQARRYKTYMADLYMAEVMLKTPLLTLMANQIPKYDKPIVLLHDKYANDIDDYLLEKLLEKTSTKIFTFNVWTSETSGIKPSGDYTLCITGPITNRADAFLEELDTPNQVFWSLDSNYQGSNARNPKRLAFPVVDATGTPLTTTPDEDQKYPFTTVLNIPENTTKWTTRWPGNPALPPRQDRLFTVCFNL